MIAPLQNPKNLPDRIYKKISREIQNIYRRKLRSKMALTAPCPSYESDMDFSVHMLICKRDILMGICAAKSFNLSANLFFNYIFHDDGSLTEEDYELLKHHFPNCQLITYDISSERASKAFEHYPLIYKYRKKAVMMLKLVDIKLFDSNKRTILLDSDILFFKNPAELLSLAKDIAGANAFNKDIDTAYILPSSTLEEVIKAPIPEKLNAGLSVIDVDLINFDQIEKWLSIFEGYGTDDIKWHRIEQSLIAMSAAVNKKPWTYLRSEYDVSFSKDVSKSVCKHYVGAIRFGFEMEGINYLLKEGDFINKWNSFTKSTDK